MTSKAFCPGHITALFYAPPEGTDAASTGSRGAGVCISLGALATVHVQGSDATTIATGEGTRLSPVVAMALGEYLLSGDGHHRVHLDLELQLPVGFGFGMSGAMAFSALMALEGELGLVGGDVDALLAFAHAAELAHRTGLGDVVAQARGGLDLRLRPGLPPKGDVVTRLQEAEVLVAWSRRPLHTRSVLSDQDARERLEAAYAARGGAPSNGPDLDWLLREGWAFARDAGLVSSDVQQMIDLCAPHGMVSQVMLGNSVFAVGDLRAMAFNLQNAGYAHRVTTVDNVGVRLVDHSRRNARRPP